MRDPKAKLAHLDACLSPEIEYRKSAGFDEIALENQAGVDISLNKISLDTAFLGKSLKAPLMIAPMTGGMERGLELNRLWARAAEHFGIAFGVGSQRVALENPALAETFKVRQYAPKALIFANLGAAQIAGGMDLGTVQRAIDMIEADALLVHFNAVQEACQDGDVDYLGVQKNMARLCEHFSKQNLPVLVREVCFGLSQAAAKRFVDMGVSGIDCAGAGGTSWAKVEAMCAKTERRQKMGMRFGEFGIPTVDSIRNVRQVSADIPLIATGGIRSGQDMLKALNLGANLTAMARPMLVAADAGEEALFEFIEDLLLELRIALFATGKPGC
ncbi:MAG: type 2 isopentenyl-diphosphate Delta-isomerase [Myxococcota bacterium]